MTGRALTSDQKRAVLNRVLVAWLAFPEMRLGQLLANACGATDVFFFEDDDLVAAVDSYARERGR